MVFENIVEINNVFPQSFPPFHSETPRYILLNLLSANALEGCLMLKIDRKLTFQVSPKLIVAFLARVDQGQIA